MNLYDSYVILLEATVEMTDDRNIRNARKRIAKKVEAIRVKREREAARKSGVPHHQCPTFVPAWIERTNN